MSASMNSFSKISVCSMMGSIAMSNGLKIEVFFIFHYLGAKIVL